MTTLAVGMLVGVLGIAGCTDRDGSQPEPGSLNQKPSTDTKAASETLLALEQIGRAFDRFQAAHGAMPSAAIFSADGQALLSWRVALLPFLGETSLYEQFKFDEPWDGDHNRKLLAKMPAVYMPRRGPAPPEAYATYYQVFTGKEAPFNREAGMVITQGSASKGKLGPKITDFTDGVAQTFLVVEAHEAVPWTKPADLVYEAEKTLPELGFGDRFYLVLADGSSHFLKKSKGDDIIRGGITHRAYAKSLGSDPITREGQEIEPVLYSDKRSVLDQE